MSITGTSLVPVIVTVTLTVSKPPSLSATWTGKVRVTVSPWPRKLMSASATL